MRRTAIMAAALAAALCAAHADAIELNLGAAIGGAAPMTEVLRKAGPGVGLSAEVALGVIPYLDAGLRYSFAAFPQDAVDADGRALQPIYDHGIAAVVSLDIVAGSDGGWLEPRGGMPGRLWLDLGLGYHKIGREDVFGLDAALGYGFAPVDHLSVGPMFRVTADFGTSQGTAAYVVFGLTVGYDVGSLFGGAADAAIDGPAARLEGPAPPPAAPLPSPGTSEPLPPD